MSRIALGPRRLLHCNATLGPPHAGNGGPPATHPRRKSGSSGFSAARRFRDAEFQVQAGCRLSIQDPVLSIQFSVASSQLPVLSCQFSVASSQLPVLKYRELRIRYWVLGTGYSVLGTGYFVPLTRSAHK